MSRSDKVASLLTSSMKSAQRRATEATKAVVEAGVDTATNTTQKLTDLVANPELLAKVVVVSTAAQEKVNEILRQKKSIYRVGDVRITVGLPPQVTFSITRMGDPDAASSSEIIEESEGEA